MHANNLYSFVSPMGATIHAPKEGTLIHGTLRSVDLIDTYVEAVKDTPEYNRMKKSSDSALREALQNLGEDYDENAPFWDTDDAAILADDLADILDSHAPAGTYFGAHPGDGSDFGFWPEEFLN